MSSINCNTVLPKRAWEQSEGEEERQEEDKEERAKQKHMIVKIMSLWPCLSGRFY